MLNLNKICCGVDFSKESDAAFGAALEIAQKFGAELTLLHVGNGHETQLRELADRAKAKGVNAAVAMEAGEPHTQIVEFVKRGSFGLVVLGTRGRTGRPASFAGSVAETVVRTAPCPVLTLHRT